jgi:hypothetical protein
MKHLKYLATAIGLAFGSQASNAASLLFDPGGVSVAAGQDFTVTLKARDLPAGTFLGFVDVAFDSRFVSVKSASANTAVWTASSPVDIGNSDAFFVLDIQNSPGFTGVSGNVDLGTITFHADAPRTTSLLFFNFAEFSALSNSSFEPSTSTGFIIIGAAPVPLPAAAWLLGSGAMAFTFMRKRPA